MGRTDRGFGPGELVIFAAYDNNQNLVGGLPCHFKRKTGGINLKSAYPLGLKLLLPVGMLDHRDVQALTEQPTHLIDGVQFDDVMIALQDAALAFAKKMRLDAFIFEIERPLCDSTFQRMKEARRGTFIGYGTKYSGCYLRTLPATWIELRNSLSKKVKDKISYSPRFIERSGSHFTFEINREPAAFADTLQNVFRLHRSRSEQHSGRAHFNYFEDDNQSAFITELSKSLNLDGNAFVATLKIDGELVAAQLFLEHNSEVIVTYSGFNPEYHKFSPLFVLVCEVIKDAINRGVARINFLQAGQEYQTRWRAEPNLLNHFVFVNKTPASLIRMLVFVGKRRYKNRAEKGNDDRV